MSSIPDLGRNTSSCWFRFMFQNWCRERDLNPQGSREPADFKSAVFTISPFRLSSTRFCCQLVLAVLADDDSADIYLIARKY